VAGRHIILHTEETAMTDTPAFDDDTLALAARIFQLARDGDADVLRQMLEHGLSANMSNDKGDTLLMLAAYNQNVPAVQVLLAHGADPDRANDKGQTPLAGVAFKGDLAIARLLIEHGAAVEGPADGGRSALTVAAMFDRVDLVQLLLEHGADPDARDGAGASALDAAKAMGATRTPDVIAAWRARSKAAD
jgi:ankyrin repeat protein